MLHYCSVVQRHLEFCYSSMWCKISKFSRRHGQHAIVRSWNPLFIIWALCSPGYYVTRYFIIWALCSSGYYVTRYFIIWALCSPGYYVTRYYYLGTMQPRYYVTRYLVFQALCSLFRVLCNPLRLHWVLCGHYAVILFR